MIRRLAARTLVVLPFWIAILLIAKGCEIWAPPRRDGSPRASPVSGRGRG